MGPAYSLNNETDIMIEIMNNGPVQGIMLMLLSMISLLIISFQLPCMYIVISSHTRAVFIDYRFPKTAQIAMASIQSDFSVGVRREMDIPPPNIGWVLKEVPY